MISIRTLQKKYGLKIAKTDIASSKNEVSKIAESMGFPVALKIDSPDILHKSDTGAVFLNLSNKSEVEKAYEDIMSSVKSNYPSAIINGVMVQEMIPQGLEMIIGYTRDEVFGPAVMVGMGGIFTEAFKDIVFRVLPINKDDVEDMLKSLKFSELLLEGFRNFSAVNRELLIDVILKVSAFASDNIENLVSFDINPVTFFNNDYRIIDFKYLTLDKNIPVNNFIPDIAEIDTFFKARSIAIVGASGLEGKIGYIIVESILSSGYQGRVFCINPKYKKIMGLISYPSLLDIDSDIDVVVITISLKAVPEILYQCKKKGIKNVIIISAGGKETGNFEIENEIKNKAKEHKIRIIGCNCLGIFDGHSKIDTLFQPYSNMKRPGAGNISLISQSGTVGIASLELLKDCGIAKFVSYGNRIDIDEGDLIEYLSSDNDTEVISIYIEGLEKGRKFFEAAKKAALKKPVIVYKAGRSENASKAALSHTGFLSGTHNIINGIMEQAGIIQVDNLVSFIASSKIRSIYKKVKNNRVQIITNGAGAIIQAIDRIDLKRNLRFAKLANKTLEYLMKKLPSHVIIGNPIDLTGTATDEQYEISINAAINDKNIDIVMLFFVFQCKPITEKIAEILSRYKAIKPIICGTMGGEHTHYMGGLIEKNKIPVFYSIDEWVSASEALIL